MLLSFYIRQIVVSGSCVQGERCPVQRGAGRRQRAERDEQLLQATDPSARQETQVRVAVLSHVLLPCRQLHCCRPWTVRYQ